MSGSSSHTGPILDYSSPRPQGKVRLPSRSRIEMRTEVVGIIEIIVLLMVINNTWRRTALEARRDSLLLTLTAPFGMKRYEWGASQVEEFRVEATTTAEHRNSLGELEIHLAGLPLVKLFTDHPAAELQSMAVRLGREIGLGVTGANVPGNGDIA